MRTYVLYHDGCPDGFGAAWAAWLALGDKAEYIPVQYGQKPPMMLSGARVYILDFSYPRTVLERMASEYEITVLDHHKSAEEALGDLPFATFDMTKSGAVLAWEYFFPGTEVPQLLQYVQDRDLWQWKLPQSKEVNAALRSYPMVFSLWSTLALNLNRLAAEGKSILRAQNATVHAICKHARMIRFDEFNVPIVTTSCYQSEVGHHLLELFPDAPFAVSWFVRQDNHAVFSLRGRGDFDVSVVAKSLGGGGHHNAAGFVSPPDKWTTLIWGREVTTRA